jgi:hypothetical protein
MRRQCSLIDSSPPSVINSPRKRRIHQSSSTSGGIWIPKWFFHELERLLHAKQYFRPLVSSYIRLRDETRVNEVEWKVKTCASSRNCSKTVSGRRVRSASSPAIVWRRSGENVGGRKLDSGPIVPAFTAKPPIAERCVGFPGIVSDFLKIVSLVAKCVGFADLCAGFPGCVGFTDF